MTELGRDLSKSSDPTSPGQALQPHAQDHDTTAFGYL